MIKRLCVIGVGLIGGSLARALKDARAAREVVGVGRDQAHLEQARALGVIDACETDVAAGVQGAEMIVVAVPVGAMEHVFRALAGKVPDGAVVTDVGSVKGAVVEAADAAFGGVPPWFVPGHPIAGTEQSGVQASRADLFHRQRVILTALPDTGTDALERVRRMWQQAGAEVLNLDVAHHDEVLAATSHLPHVLAYALVDMLARRADHEEIFRFAAGGFRDFTRIASSDPQMWHDICLANRKHLAALLRGFQQDLGTLARAIEKGDGEALIKVFRRAKQARDRHCADDNRRPANAAQQTPEPPAGKKA